MQSSELLMGFSCDLDHTAYSFLIEANRRFGDDIMISVDVRLLQTDDKQDLLYALRYDDHAQLTIAWYF
jgi:hypothetical protein